MEKFCYSAGEIEIAATQCDLCIYQIEDNRTACQKFVEKPEEVLQNKRKCVYVRNAKLLDL